MKELDLLLVDRNSGKVVACQRRPLTSGQVAKLGAHGIDAQVGEVPTWDTIMGWTDNRPSLTVTFPIALTWH